MDFETIVLKIEGPVATITLNRPPVNAVSYEMGTDLDDALNIIDLDKNVRAVILTGSGEKGFCAGMDVKASIASKGKNIGRHLNGVYNRLEFFNKPIIAAINGFALGGGLEMALACHLRIMTDAPGAYLALPEINLGIMPGWGGTVRMPRIVGKAKALELILLAEKISPQEALRLGIVNSVCKPEELSVRANELALKLSKRAPLTVKWILESINKGMATTEWESFDIAQNSSREIGKTKDSQEGKKAFVEKREPDFKGE